MGRRQRTINRGRVAVPVLGIDVGGVLVDRVAEGSDTSFFGANPMATPAVPRAFEAVAKLCSEDFGYRVHIVSKAGPRIAGRTREWLGRTGFFEQTGVSPSNVWFVRKRIEKAPVCARLGVTHFVDDRLDVLEHLTTVQHRYLFLGGLGEHPAPKHVPARFRAATDWSNLVAAIRRDA